MSGRIKRAQNTDRPLWKRIAIDIAGFGLMILSPLVSFLPGPGGIPVFLAGLGLVSLNHEWAANLLKKFEERWLALIDKVLMAHPWVARLIDILAVAAICGGLYISLTQSELLIKGFGFGLFSMGIVLIVSNQKRIHRLSAWFKKRSQK